MAGSLSSRRAVRAIVLRGEELLVMDRNNNSKKYLTLVGGGIERGETAEEAVLREVLEETGMQVANPRLVFIENSPEYGVVQHVFLCEYLGGEPSLTAGSEEYVDNMKGLNLYAPRFVPISNVVAESDARPFVTPRLLKEIQLGLKSGFGNSPKEWTN